MDQEFLASSEQKEKFQESMIEPRASINPQTNPSNPSSERIIPISLSPKPFTKHNPHNPNPNPQSAPENRLETTNNNDYYKKVSDIISNNSYNNNSDNNESSHRRSLLVTLEDGSTTETQGSIRDIKRDRSNPSVDIIDIGIDIVNNRENDSYKSSPKQVNEQYSNLLNSSDGLPYADADLQSIDNFSIEGDNRITIEEIEQTTLEREITNREFRTDFKENDPNLSNTETRDESKVSPNWNKNIHHKIRLVPIKLDDGKVIQKNQEETIETKSEFTNYSHQEFIENPTMKEIPRFDSTPQKRNMPSESSRTFVKERVIPITLENTGQTIIPSFTKLEDPQPPEWSIFSQRNVPNQSTKESIIPIRMVDMADEESVSVAGSEYENAPRQRHDSNSKPKLGHETKDKDSSPSHTGGDKTGTRPKTKLSSQMSQDNSFSAKPPIGINKAAHSHNENNVDSSRDNRSFSKASPEKPKLPPKPKSPSIKKKEENTTTDTKKILSKTTETTKTTTEKRSQTVRFNLDDDDDEKDEKESKSDSNGKRTKFDNSRMRHKPPPYGASYRSNSADGGMGSRDGHSRMSSRGYPHNVTRDDTSTRSRVRSRSGPYYRAYPTADGTKVEYSHDDEKALQEIDKDITRIWRELQELDGMSPAKNEQSSTPGQKNDQNQDSGTTNIRNNGTLNGNISKEAKPKYETVTVREFTMPSPISASPTRIRSISSSGQPKSPLSKADEKERKLNTDKVDTKQRTIWDMDCSEPLDPNHIPNYSTPSRRSRDTTQKSGLVKPTWRRSLSGSRNPYEELSTKNDSNKMSTSLVSDAPIQSQAFATPFGTKITPTPIRRSQQSNRQTPSPQRPLSSSYIPPSYSSATTDQKRKMNSDTKNSTAALPIEKSVRPLNQSDSKHDSIAYADEDFLDCVDDFPSSSLNRNNARTDHITNGKTKDNSNGPNTTANSVAIQTGQSTDAATQTGNDTDVKSGKSSKSSCVIA